MSTEPKIIVKVGFDDDDDIDRLIFQCPHCGHKSEVSDPRDEHPDFEFRKVESAELYIHVNWKRQDHNEPTLYYGDDWDYEESYLECTSCNRRVSPPGAVESV